MWKKKLNTIVRLMRRKVNDIPECNIISLIKLEIVLQIFMNPQYMVDSEEAVPVGRAE